MSNTDLTPTEMQDLVTVELQSATVAATLAGMLQDEGIPAFTHSEYNNQAGDSTANVEIRVPRKLEERARALLAEIRQSGASGAEAALGESQAPVNTGFARVFWSIVLVLVSTVLFFSLKQTESRYLFLVIPIGGLILLQREPPLQRHADDVKNE